MQWLTRTLGEICDEVDGTIRTGPFGSQLHQSDYKDEGLPVVMPKDIVDGKVSTEGIARIGNEDVERLSQHRLRKGDIVYGRRGDIGRRALITEREVGWLCGTGCLRISLGDSVLDPTFLYYYLGDSKVIGWIQNQAIGATLPNLNTSIIRSISITYPSVSSQQKIASILSNYDRLIGNNTRRIQILEEMARSLYNEWFVRYPAQATGQKILKDVCELIVDCEHKTAPTQATGYPSIRTPNIGRGRLLLDKVNRVSEETYVTWTKRATPQAGDLILAREAPVGNVAIIPRKLKVCLGQRTVLIRADTKQVEPYYLLFLLLSDSIQNKLFSFANGATVHHLNMKDIRDLELSELHSLQSQRKISSILSSYYELIFNLTEKTDNLRQTRDLLLPKLISGEIDVESLDIESEGQAIGVREVSKVREAIAV